MSPVKTSPLLSDSEASQDSMEIALETLGLSDASIKILRENFSLHKNDGGKTILVTKVEFIGPHDQYTMWLSIDTRSIQDAIETIIHGDITRDIGSFTFESSVGGVFIEPTLYIKTGDKRNDLDYFIKEIIPFFLQKLRKSSQEPL